MSNIVNLFYSMSKGDEVAVLVTDSTDLVQEVSCNICSLLCSVLARTAVARVKFCQ